MSNCSLPIYCGPSTSFGEINSGGHSTPQLCHAPQQQDRLSVSVGIQENSASYVTADTEKTPLLHDGSVGCCGEEESGTKSLLKSMRDALRKVVPSSGRRRAGAVEIPHQTGSVSASGSQYPILGVSGDRWFEPPSPFSGEVGMVNVRRPIFSQKLFQGTYQETPPPTRATTFTSTLPAFLHTHQQHQPHQPSNITLESERDPFGSTSSSCWTCCVNLPFSIFPFLGDLKSYSLRRDFPGDFLSGVTGGILRIPQSMAYAMLVKIPPVFGLYTAFFSALFYVIFGGSRDMAAGVQGVISLMVGAAMERVLLKNEITANISLNDFLNYSTNSKGSMEENANLQVMLDIIVTVTFLVGVIQASMGLLRLGFITNYLSDPLIGGFTTGAACHVLVSQIPPILGIEIHEKSGYFNLLFALNGLVKNIRRVNLVTLSVSVVSLAALLTFKWLTVGLQRWRQMKIPLPGELLVLVAGIGFSFLVQGNEQLHVTTVGTVPNGFLAPRVPVPKYMFYALPNAIVIAIVSFAIGYSIAKGLAIKHDYDISGNREIFAFGFTNAASSFLNCFVSTASMSASSIHESLGGKTQVSNLVASSLVLLSLLFLGPVFSATPKCILSVIILVNLKSFLSQFRDLKPLWNLSRIDFFLWVVTWAAVVILDVDIGLGIGVAFSLFTIVFRTQWPYTCILGRIPSTDIYKNVMVTPLAREIPGIVIFRFEGALYFASAEHFRNSLYRESRCNPVKIQKARLEYAKKLQAVKEQMQITMYGTGQAHHHAVQGSSSNDAEDSSDESSRLLARSLLPPPTISDVHHIVVDFSTCGFIDSVGVRTLSHIVGVYAEVNIKVFLANVRAAVRRMLLFPCPPGAILSSRKISTTNIFLSVHDAVLAALADAQKMEERDVLLADSRPHPTTRQASCLASDMEFD